MGTVLVLEASRLPTTTTTIPLEGKEVQTPVDSYVEVTVIEENKRHRSKKTSTRKESSNPYFNETFEFDLASPERIEECSIIATVYSISGWVPTFVGRVQLCADATGRELKHWED